MKGYFVQWPRLFLTVLFFGSMIISCSVPRYMYAPNSVNIPSFTQKSESFANITLSIHGTDLQAGYAFHDHWAVLGSWYQRHYSHDDQNYHSGGWGRSPYVKDSLHYRRDLFSLGVAYFTPLGKRHHDFITIFAGYGRGRFGMISHQHEQGYPDSTLFENFIYQ